MRDNGWVHRMRKANRMSAAYGLRSRVCGVRGPNGWYYLSCFAPQERQRIGAQRHAD